MNYIKKLSCLALVLVFVMILAMPVMAATKVATFGRADSGVYNLEAKSDGIVYVRPSGGLKMAYEKATSTDTLTAQESGKQFSIAPVSDMILTLPTAEVGMFFKFVAVDGDNIGGKQITINPQDGDTLRGVAVLGTTTTYAAGDATQSDGDSGETISVFCSEALFWDVDGIRGTWTDVN